MQNDDELLANVPEVAGSKVLPPCVITTRLGRGGMGSVYRARHLNLAIDVAVKVMKPQLVADDPQFVARFKREGQSAAAISHQNVIRVFDVAEYAGLHFLIMELVVGETARERVERKGRLSVAEAVQITHDAALGLGAAHALGIVHRDVKPDNLLVSNSGQVKVADLGLAKPTMGGGGGSLMSTANQVMGTPSYMPPEQWESPAVGPPADVWALGATLWFLLAGEEAFDSRDGNYPRVMKQIVLQPFPDLRKHRDDVPEGVLAVLAKATAKNADERYADADALAAALAALAIPRVSLRDVADTSDARTLVSPVKELDRIKQWLREENLARQTPAPRATGQQSPATTPRPLGVPITGTVLQPPPGPAAEPVRAPRRGMAVGLGVLALAAAAGGYFAFGRGGAPARPEVPVARDPGKTGKPETPRRDPDPPPPAPRDRFADVDELAARSDFEGALAKYAALVQQSPQARDDQRAAALEAKWAEQLAGKREWKRALERMRVAVDLDAALAARRAALRDSVRAAAATAFEIEEPRGRIAPGERRFKVRLDVDAVTRLTLGDAPAAPRDAAGRFVQAVRIGSSRDLAVGIELADGHTASLTPVRLDVATSLRPLTFRATPIPTDARMRGGLALTTQPTIEVRGELSEGPAELTCDGTRLENVQWQDGAFTCALPIPTPDTESTLRVVARKDGCADAAAEVRVARLVAAPTFAVVEPAAPFATEAMTTAVRVRVDRWVESVEARVGETRTALQPVADEAFVFAGKLPLRTGDNTIEIAAKDVLGRAAAPMTLTMRCTIAPAAVLGVTLMRADGNEELQPNRMLWLRSAGGSLRARSSGERTQLYVNDAELAPAGIDLDLRDGVMKQYVFRAVNELGKSVDYTVAIGLDASPPKLTITSPPNGATVASERPITFLGTWEDASGEPKIFVVGRPAKVESRTPRSGTWSFLLDGQRESRPLNLRAVDEVGNEDVIKFPLLVDPALRAKMQVPKGFTGDAAIVNDAGWCKRIHHDATGITLVAMNFDANSRPTLYVGQDLVSERQFEGKASDQFKLGVAGRDVMKWLAANGFELLEQGEYQVYRDDPDLLRMATGPIEWLQPKAVRDAAYPVAKDASSTQSDARAAAGKGFRAVYRVR